MVFTRATSQFELSYDASTRASERTTIFLSEKYHYPNGFNATCVVHLITITNTSDVIIMVCIDSVSPTGYATLHHQSPYLFVNHTTAIAEGQVIYIQTLVRHWLSDLFVCLFICLIAHQNHDCAC
jgi:hypothetical protein